MKLSSSGLAFLSREEGLVLHPYNDSAGHATIGVGHLLHFGPVTAKDQVTWRGFTRADALKLLKIDVASREEAVTRLVTVPLNQNQFDALVSFVFNIGAGAFVKSTALRYLNARKYTAAADALLLFRIGGAGLLARRKRERALFLKPVALSHLLPNELAWIREYDSLKPPSDHLKRRRELRDLMTAQRKRIWRAAQKTGWDRANRRLRYASLYARTK